MISNTLHPLFLLLLVLCCSCKSSSIDANRKTVKPTISFEEKELIKEIYSKDRSKLLILKYVAVKSPTTTYHYTVKELPSGKELKKGTFVGTKMEWSDANTLKGYLHVGMVKKEEDLDLIKERNPNMKFILIKIQ